MKPPRFAIYFTAPGTLIAEGDDLDATKARAIEVVAPRFEQQAREYNPPAHQIAARLARLQAAFAAELAGKGAGWVRIVDRQAPPTMHIVCDALSPGEKPLGSEPDAVPVLPGKPARKAQRGDAGDLREPAPAGDAFVKRRRKSRKGSNAQ